MMKDDTPTDLESFYLEDFIPYRLAVITKAVSTAFSKTYAERFDITIPQWRVMAAIGREPNCSASSIVKYTVLDKVQVSRAVSGLIEMGHVERRSDEKDRRNSVLSFTEQGRGVYEQIVPAGRAFEERLMAVMSSQDIDELDRLLDKLMAQAKEL
jgi:DNA-binding MarR family transcriptional regulator|tara:strand:- start:85 stop:549 length:465 start_codon:yes stop_codon:yes gene_type:complete